MNELILYVLYALGYRTPLSTGECFHYGTYVTKDALKARTYYLEAVQLGDVKAFRQLSLLSQEEGLSGDYYYYVGMMNESEKKWDLALDAYLQAEIYRHGEAIYRLGKLYESSKRNIDGQFIIKKDLHSELAWYKKALQFNSDKAKRKLVKMCDSEPEAAYILGERYESSEIDLEKNKLSAIKYYEKACKKQHKQAALRLGKLYEFGCEGLKQKPEKAIDCYLIVAKHGSREALISAEKLINQVGIQKQQMQLVEIYLSIFKDTLAAMKYFKTLADKNNFSTLVTIEKLAKINPEGFFILARLYEEDQGLENHLQKACEYYSFAMGTGHSQSLEFLEKLAKSGNSDAQYNLAYGYFKLGEIEASINWCMSAVEQNHPQAIDYLNNMHLNAQQYIQIAERYDEGKYVKRNIDSVIFFYTKAVKLNSTIAALQLGKLYELGSQGLDTQPDKAIDFYLIASEQSSKDGLVFAEHLINQFGSEKQQLRLAQLYWDGFKDRLSSMTLYLILANKGNKSAEYEISRLSIRDPDCAYTLGTLNEGLVINDIKKACSYYLASAKLGHKYSLQRLLSLAQAGNSEALYSLSKGCVKTEDAIPWCMLAAELNHVEAIEYLNTYCSSPDICYQIAIKYERGEGVKQNINLAILFYRKTFEPHKEADQLYFADNKLRAKAAFQLGQIYQLDLLPHHSQDHEKSCDYFIKAARRGYLEALIPLERLSEEVSPAMQFKIGDLYRDFLNNEPKAIYHYQHALDNGYGEAKDRLVEIEKCFMRSIRKYWDPDDRRSIHDPSRNSFFSFGVSPKLNSDILDIKFGKKVFK